ncbi:pyridoxamine 5'-phosphate oxidase family protein [Streptomyces adustus]|uniref:Pyridoxamine 5'-phosphate oxidase family protein n=1 Tax=Streptomyces adustus TaxID=1609272 RepID=A0A5N8V7Y4_9ACTN|nr:pyridoxamine 5'-phosphate oxidase family protein [Streptomyces adustus]MPY30174.1 pyridoxamine 5'-phosphate oxidase family protein [Streptomyces adustus]
MSVYHAGSRALQEQAGLREAADHVGRAVGDGIKPVAAAFLELQPLLVIGAADPATGRIWASPLSGEPGFVRATGPRQISVTGGPAPGDPLAGALARPDVPVATIALDPRTRRRMRLNGRSGPTRGGFSVTAERVFANCPKYIQRRAEYWWDPHRRPGPSRHGHELSGRQAAFVAGADTFFLATAGPSGVEASHRGGNPGFVQVMSPTELSWPDYPGNAMFLSLGNLALDPRAGLLFLDWADGTILQLTGRARTESAADGTRTVRFSVEHAVETSGAVPLRWAEPEFSPANPAPTE